MRRFIKAAIVAFGLATGAGIAGVQAAPVAIDAGLTTQAQAPTAAVEQVQYYARPYGYGYRRAFRPRFYGRRHFGYGPRFGYRRHYGPRFYGRRGFYRY